MKGRTLKGILVVVAVVLVVFVSIVLVHGLPVIWDTIEDYPEAYERACENATGGCQTVPDCDEAGDFYPGPTWLWCPMPLGVLLSGFFFVGVVGLLITGVQRVRDRLSGGRE